MPIWLIGFFFKMKKFPWIKILAVLVPLIIVVVTLFVVYDTGRDAGRNQVQTQWDEQKLLHNAAITKLQGEIKEKEQVHVRESQRITDELRQVRTSYDAELTRLNDTYTRRLSDSAARGDRYRTLAEGGTAQCRSVASRAAELDASIEQGRRVVEELRSTLEQRDAQLRLLGSQIQNDRGLLGK